LSAADFPRSGESAQSKDRADRQECDLRT